jgi:cytochrome c oxidase assembly factor CtaG
MTDVAQIAAATRASVLQSKYGRIAIASFAFTLVLLADPIDSFADQNLTAHMFQHIGVFIFSAFFGFAIHKILISSLVSLKRATIKGWIAFVAIMRFNSTTKGLVFSGLIPTFVFVFWGIPYYFDFAVTDGYVHILEHLSYIMAGGFVGLSANAIPSKYKALLLCLGFMTIGMMGSMMLVWPPGFYPIFSPSQNVDMSTAMMLVGALGIAAVGSWFLKVMDVI